MPLYHGTTTNYTPSLKKQKEKLSLGARKKLWYNLNCKVAFSGECGMANATANKTTGDKVLSEQKKNRIFEVLAEGIPFVDKSVTDLADEYLSKYHSRELAAKKLINNQIFIVGSSGGLSGLVNSYSTNLVETAGKSLQAANISTALYLQIRMVAAIATIGGYDIQDDEVKGQMYACLMTSAVSDAIKSPGATVVSKSFVKLIEKIPFDWIKAVNQKMGFRFITKKGKTGAVNLIDLVPIACACAVAGIDALSTKLIAVRAYNAFIETSSEDIIIIETDDESNKQ